jgi:hypothetical protein
MPTRCRSKCSDNKSVASCNAADKCSYTNGAIRKYCRLSSKYKMNKPNCNITRKFLKREKGPAEKIRQFIERKHATRKRNASARTPELRSSVGVRGLSRNGLPSKDNVLPQHETPLLLNPRQKKEPTEEEIRAITNKAHTRRIEKFMRKLNPGKIRANRARYLNGVCSDSGVCIAFGTHIKKIKKHFDGFVNFNHVNSIRKIGEVSSNGFVKELEYEHEGYKAHAVLKSATKVNSDNLYYEYLVGIFVNYICKFSPNFLETYGIYKYNSDAEYQEMQKLTAKKDALSGLDLIDTTPLADIAIEKTTSREQQKSEHLRVACKQSKYISILIQHIKDAETLHNKCSSVMSIFFIRNDLHNVLFQVYWTLFVLNNRFTHYDLHTNNVLLYQPDKNSFIQYFCHMDDGSVISFRSSYIAKIIDYGRCYYDFGIEPTDKDNYDVYAESTDIYDALCKEKKCKPKCGNGFGFRTFNDDFYKKFHIDSLKPNVSHDLRLLNILGNFANIKNKIKTHNPIVSDLLRKVVYNSDYGTPENNAVGYPATINNVKDAMWALKDIIQDPTIIARNMAFYAETSGRKKLGEMHLYESRHLEYIPVV